MLQLWLSHAEEYVVVAAQLSWFFLSKCASLSSKYYLRVPNTDVFVPLFYLPKTFTRQNYIFFYLTAVSDYRLHRKLTPQVRHKELIFSSKRRHVGSNKREKLFKEKLFPEVFGPY